MRVTYRDRVWIFDEPLVAARMLELVDVLPESVLIVREGRLVVLDQQLDIDDEVSLFSVITGG